MKRNRENETNNEAQIQEVACHICMEELIDKKAVIDCKHYFCLTCIQKWAEIENTCPYCKQRFTLIKERKIKKGKRRLN